MDNSANKDTGHFADFMYSI